MFIVSVSQDEREEKEEKNGLASLFLQFFFLSAFNAVLLFSNNTF